ncbi:hypothetical protein HTZ84_04940 [Haloterrigena sp. SYSU A558-1]|uniref:Apea-like HEPN domain-containing protein n=1 Tax=Haloterrigena gelatinilytica TaxID=2741724 RepID=A0ABX2L610_9EURY|nr:hypothetical protein [Haloterrigena gelatinilytica]NUC71662.1 hypothetical protein [Haloterrigena gelatinilytica]
MTEQEDNGEDEKSEYNVSIPIYSFPAEGRLSSERVPEDESGVPDFVNSLDDFNKIRYKTSNIHINSALFFADEVKRIEKHLVGKTDPEEDEPRLDTRIPIGNRHDIYVVNSVTSTVSFLEAVVNEFYDTHLDIAEESNELAFDRDREKIAVQNDDFYDLLTKFDKIEDQDFERLPVLKKYQYLLSFSGNNPFDHGSEPYQSTYLVKQWRNRLVHAQVEWIDFGEGPSFAKSLEGKFEKNPIGTDLPFPRSYLSYDCSKWCIESAFEFVEEFYNRMNVEPPVHIKNHMGDLWEVDSIIHVEEADDTGES